MVYCMHYSVVLPMFIKECKVHCVSVCVCECVVSAVYIWYVYKPYSTSLFDLSVCLFPGSRISRCIMYAALCVFYICMCL